MTSEFQAGKMILSQIGMFNEAAILFEHEIQPAVLGAIDECVEVFAKAEQWPGNFELAGDECDCRLAPEQWNQREDDTDFDPRAWFAVDCVDDKDDHWTALLCKQGSAGGEAGFMFAVDSGVYGTKASCSKYLSSLNDETLEQLRKIDFKLVDYGKGKKTFFLPIVLNADSLAETWGNSGEFSEANPCFEPVKVALEKLKMAWPIFDGILKAWPVKA